MFMLLAMFFVGALLGNLVTVGCYLLISNLIS